MELNPGKKEVTFDIKHKKLAEEFDEIHISDNWNIGSLYDKNLELKDDQENEVNNNIMELSTKVDDLQNLVETIADNQDEFKDKIIKEIKKINTQQEKIMSALENIMEVIQVIQSLYGKTN